MGPVVRPLLLRDLRAPSFRYRLIKGSSFRVIKKLEWRLAGKLKTEDRQPSHDVHVPKHSVPPVVVSPLNPKP